MNMREKKTEAVAAIAAAGSGALAAWESLLKIELEEARLEMETSADTTDMWRAQGRIAEIRVLLGCLNRGNKQ